MCNNGFFGYSSYRAVASIIANEPLFSGDITPGGTCTANSNYPGYTPDDAINDNWDNDAEGWLTNGINTNSWWNIQLASAQIVTRISIRNGQTSSSTRGVRDCIIYGSNDGTNYTKIPVVAWTNCSPFAADGVTFTSASVSTIQTVDLNNETPYLHYKIYAYNNWGDSYLGIMEVEMFRDLML